VASDCVRHPLNLAIVRRADEAAQDPYFRATGAVCSLPELTQASAASGFLNAAPDPDGILRRVPLVLELDGRVYPGLALAAVSTATGARGVALRVANGNAASLVLSKVDAAASGRPIEVPLDGKGNLLVRFRGRKRTFPYVSAADVMSGRTAPGAFAGKVVFVGTTALGTREVVATPLDTLFAGVEVQATVADNLLRGDFTSRPEHAVAAETQTVLVLGLVAALLVLRFGLAWGTAAAATGGVAMWAGAVALLAHTGTLLSPLYPGLGLVSALAAMTVAGVTVERRRAEKAGRETVTSQRLMVQTLLSLTGIRDAETGKHSQRTQRYARVLATELAKHPSFKGYLTPERVELVASLAPLHDIGKVGVPDRVLNKPGGLTPEELAEMRRHPEYGREVILKAERETGVHDDLTLTVAKDIVYTHHEKWDGSGYPRGLRGEEIPIPGRLMAVVDVYDAIRTRQLYLASMSDDDAVALIIKGRGTHFDPDVVDAFIAVAHVFRSLSAEDAPAPGLRNAS
jgi:adenylate cyclase